MKRKRQFWRKGVLLLLTLMLMVSAVAAPVATQAATVTKVEKSYNIAVVFDNSGSMYYSQSWCRAKYSMEIFASMLDYSKDKLAIFPMWEVTTDGSKPAYGGSYDPIEIKSKEDINKISNLYTIEAYNTPFAPVSEAYEYLSNASADEKWLVVLTDGEFNIDQRTDQKEQRIDLQGRLSSLASKDIKVQYLGFGGASNLRADEANYFFSKSSSDVSLKDDLVDICNSIFQRSVLPADRINDGKLNLDLSMKNLIVFVQGADAKIDSLKDSSGSDIAITLDSGQRKYSEIKAGGWDNAPVDTSLAGQVVTFAACPKGEYTLSYSGAEKIQIFYEPDVGMDIEITNSDGQKVENADNFTSGEYTFNSKIVDSVTGEDVTSHPLLGQGVQIKTGVKTSADSDYKWYENGEKIAFTPDSSTNIKVEGTYLGKYTISSEDDPRFSWISNIDIKKPTVDLNVEISKDPSWFVLKEHDSWQPIRVSLTIDGQPLTEEQMTRTSLTADIDGLKYRTEALPGESAYNIYICQNENGEYVEPATGKYELKATAAYTDEYGVESRSQEQKLPFEIQKYSLLVRRLIVLGIILIILAILTIATIILHKIKVLPKGVQPGRNSTYLVDEQEDEHVRANISRNPRKSLFKQTGRLSINAGIMNASFDIEACDTLFKWPFRYQSSPARGYKIKNASASDMDYVKIGTYQFIPREGKFKVQERRNPKICFEKYLGDRRYYVETRVISK